MALNGIDAQIMVQRTTDYSKDEGAAARRAELGQEYAAAMHEAETDVKIHTVMRQEAVEKALINDERESSRAGAGDTGSSRQESGREAEEKEEELATEPGTGSVIDIRL